MVPSTAAWTDPVGATGTELAAHALAPPASATCSTPLVLAATVSWPADARYDYEVVLRRVSPDTVVSTKQVSGTASSVTYTGLTDFGVGSVVAPVDFQVEIRSYLAGTPSWRSAAVRTYTYIRLLQVVIVGASTSCTT